MKVTETIIKEEEMVTNNSTRIEPMEQHFRLILEDLGGLFENPENEQLAKSIRGKLSIANKAYHKNLLFDWLKRKLFEFGVYQHQEFSLKLFLLKKRKVEKLLETFRNITAEGIIRKYITQVFVELEEDHFGNPIEEIVNLINSSVYDGNTHARMMKTMQEKVPLEIEEIFSENIQDSLQRTKLEKHVILFDRTNKIIYWTKESFETLVQQVKDYQKKIQEQESECTSLNQLVALIGKIRERQTRQIINLNSINQQHLSLLSPELREQIEKVLQENESVRTLISQGFNTSSFHFILEFIQNADDSEYLGDGVLEFHFNSKNHSLKIKSNECGFTYDNLYALAGMADSDKVAKKLETPVIGEKGIGFKTVFSVCSEIHLLSNGFDVSLTSHKLFNKNNLTEFELTYGTEYEMKNINKFDHSIFDKYTLLTLKNIRKVVFKDDQNTTIYSLLQRDKNLFALVTEVNGMTKSIECFYAFSSSVDMTDVVCEKRPNFKTANLTLFYPEKWENKRFKLHSYLPVKEDYNLQLLIQSDFLLIQNRESLVEDLSNWNNSIIDEIPKLIVQSLTTNSLRNKSIKDVGEWKYDIFKMLQDCPLLHFKDVKPKTIELLKSVKCIPVMDESKFELPSNTILIGQSPVHPFKEFGIVECTKILGMHCIDPKLQEHLVKDMFSMQILNKSDVLKLVNELPCDIKLNKRVQLYQLMEHFKIDVCALDVAIIPTKLTKLLKPKEMVCCFKEYNFSEGALKILEKFGCHKVADDIAPFFDKLLKPLKKSVRIEKLSNEEKFVLWVEETENTFIAETLCLTTDGQWFHPSNCYFQSEHTQYLTNAKFVDLLKLQIILQQHSSRVTANQLQEVLFKHGVKKVPILFKGFYKPTDEFLLLVREKNNTEKLISYLDNNLKLFESEKSWIECYLDYQLSNLYEPNLRYKFGDILNYLPYTTRLRLVAKSEDFDAHKLYILHHRNASSIIQGLESFKKHTLELIRTEPLLKTTDGDFVKLDDNNSKLFVTLDRLVKKYRPNWRELDRSYNRIGITNLVDNCVSTFDFLSILQDDNPTLEDQEYFIVQILSTSLYYTASIMVTIDGEKKLLSDMYWNLDMREVFSVSVNQLLLYPHFTSATIKDHVQKTHDIRKCEELCELLQTLLKKIVGQPEKLDNIERVQLETLISSKFAFSLSNEMVWELEELCGIAFFEKYNLTKLFGTSAQLAKEHDTKKETRRITNTILSEFIQQEIITDNQFLQAWKYAKKGDHHQEVFNLILQKGLIVHNNKKHHYTNLFRRISKDVQIKFPHLQSLLVSDQYIDFNISQEIPIDLLCKEIEKLENQKEGNDKCFTLYKEIDRQLKEGTIKDVTPFKKFNIFRNDKGQHCRKVYYCENQEVCNQLGSLVDCLFLCDNNAISHFLQAFEILPISQRVSYSNLTFEISDKTFELLNALIGNINLYLDYNKFKSKEIRIQIVKMINMKATIDGIQKNLTPDIHSDIEKGIIYIKEEICNADKLFKEMRFSNAFLQFYPQLEKTLQDCVKLLILSHGGTEETIKTAMSIILPIRHAC